MLEPVTWVIKPQLLEQYSQYGLVFLSMSPATKDSASRLI